MSKRGTKINLKFLHFSPLCNVNFSTKRDKGILERYKGFIKILTEKRKEAIILYKKFIIFAMLCLYDLHFRTTIYQCFRKEKTNIK